MELSEAVDTATQYNYIVNSGGTGMDMFIGMDSVTDICKHPFLWFETIMRLKVNSGHQAKKVKQKMS